MINKVMTNSMNDMPLHRIFSDVVHGVEKTKMAVMTIIMTMMMMITMIVLG